MWAHRRAFRAGRGACRCTLSDARRSLFPHHDREIRAELFTKVAGNTALWIGYVRITPFVHFEGLLRAESNAVAAPFAPGGIKTYVGTGFLCFDRFIFSCGHVSFFSQYHNGHGPTNSQTLTVFQFSLVLVIPANHHDLLVTTEHESAAIESGATDVFRPAGLIRACRLLPYGRARMSLRHIRGTRFRINSCIMGTNFQANAGIQKRDRQGRVFYPNASEAGLLAHRPGPRIGVRCDGFQGLSMVPRPGRWQTP